MPEATGLLTNLTAPVHQDDHLVLPYFTVRVELLGSSGQRGGLGGLPTPLVVLCAGIIYSALLSLSVPQK